MGFRKVSAGPRFEPGFSKREAVIIHLPCHHHESNGQRYLVVGVLRLHRDGEEVGMVRNQPAEKSGDFTGLVFGGATFTDGLDSVCDFVLPSLE